MLLEPHRLLAGRAGAAGPVVPRSLALAEMCGIIYVEASDCLAPHRAWQDPGGVFGLSGTPGVRTCLEAES
jgi:hypothetical protein